MTHKPKASQEDFFKLCELLEIKIALFKDLISATASLKDRITQHNTDAVELIISRRNGYMTAIDKIDNKICRLKEEKSFHEGMLTAEGRKRIKSLLKTLEHVIDKTLLLNQSCEAAAEDALNGLRNNLSGLGHRSTSFKGYRNLGTPRFLDVKT